MGNLHPLLKFFQASPHHILRPNSSKPWGNSSGAGSSEGNSASLHLGQPVNGRDKTGRDHRREKFGTPNVDGYIHLSKRRNSSHTLPETNSSPMKIRMFPCKYHQNAGFSMANC